MYTLVNKTDYKYKSLNFQDKFLSIISLLEHIEYELYVLKKHGVNKKIDFDKFNNLFIQYISENNTLINTYKFNFKNYSIIDLNNEIVNINSFDQNINKTYNYLIERIKNNTQVVNVKIITKTLKSNKSNIFKKNSKKKINKNEINNFSNSISEDKESINSEELQKKNQENAEKFIEKEKKSEKKSIYKSDVIVFRKLNEEIKSKKRSVDNLPDLFKNKFPVLLEMDNNNLLEDSENFEIYHDLINNDENEKSNEKKEYIPHNINYKESNMNKKYKSLDEMLEEISSIDTDNESLSD
jgi:hypothetical protein